MHLKTRRCLIRPFREQDLDDFMAYRNNPEWMRHQSFKNLTREAYADALLKPQPLTAGVQLAIVHKRSGRLIGDLYLRQVGDQFWIGYTICPGEARKGFATEAVCAAIQALKASGGVRVLASVAPENTASVALLRKLGFVPDAMADGDQIYMLNP